MSSELRLKKLRGSGGYVMAKVSDEQQVKGNLGGPDLFLAPIGRLNPEIILKHFCNTCEKEIEGPPKIEYENPNEEVAENLILVEKGQYICETCNATLAEYRDFKKQDEIQEVGAAKPIESVPLMEPESTPVEQVQTTPNVQNQEQPQISSNVDSLEPTAVRSINSIQGLQVYDENAKKIGIARQVGIDSNQTMVLLITKDDGTEGSIPWSEIGKIGDIILLGKLPIPQGNQPGKCPICGFENSEGSKFCEECGAKLQ